MVSALNKLLLTRLRDRNAAVRVEEGRVRQIDFAPSQAEEEVGAVYVGKVRNIVKNIQAAFVEYRPGVNGFYSLAENRRHLYTDGREHSVLKAGDEILVQVSRAAVKTKDAVLTSRISLTGVYAVYIAGTEKKSAQLNISKKITDVSWREAAETWWEKQELTDCEVILRTNAAQADFSLVEEEIRTLSDTFRKMLEHAPSRVLFSVLYRPESFSLREAKGIPQNGEWEIVSDQPEIMTELKEYAGPLPKLRFYDDASYSLSALYSLETELERALKKTVWLKSGGYLVIEPTEAMTVIDVNTGKNTELKEYAGPLPKLRFYDDASYSLSALYSLETELERALKKTVWLKSGDYLVIEPTEAMTVIDVNTGKNTEKRTAEETYFKTNLEAAAEIAVQLRLRNLSGIIIVDFIDMASSDQKKTLLQTLRNYLQKDPVKTVVVDITALGLVELTRKKISRPLHEIIKEKEIPKL